MDLKIRFYILNWSNVWSRFESTDTKCKFRQNLDFTPGRVKIVMVGDSRRKKGAHHVIFRFPNTECQQPKKREPMTSIPPLSSYPKREQAKRKEIIRRLTDPNYILAPYLEQHITSKNPIRDGFLPVGSDFRDFTVVENRGTFHAFYIDVRHGKHSRRPDNPFYNGHASTEDFMTWEIPYGLLR